MKARGSIIRSSLINPPLPPPVSVPSSARKGSSGSGKKTWDAGGDTNVPGSRTQSVHSSNRKPSVQRSRRGKLSRGSSTDSYASVDRGRDREKERYLEQRKAEIIESELEEKKELFREELRKEKLTMLVFSILSLFCGMLWLLAVSLDRWYIVTGEMTNVPTVGRFIWSRSGLWKNCRVVETENRGEEMHCEYNSLFPSQNIAIEGTTDQHVIDYKRTEVSFAIISVFLLPMAVLSSFYTLRNDKYTYKRLTACLYFLLAITVLVVIEVVITCVSYEKVSLPFLHPTTSSFSYGFCFYTGWFVFLFYLVTAALFLAYSRKRKESERLIDEERYDAELEK